ncbi:hypothetical protein SELMODRAFT_417219 [Selaginella moellendorffii]|uniref:Uncharacterized protein n=1 Tax=Selaginella moellendorffii TaxID=88036 RepID=D8S1R9_SELML|nr:hypothetical protein SELMODRAFT_417219 [Selaginella moellendorffii]
MGAKPTYLGGRHPPMQSVGMVGVLQLRVCPQWQTLIPPSIEAGDLTARRMRRSSARLKSKNLQPSTQREAEAQAFVKSVVPKCRAMSGINNSQQNLETVKVVNKVVVRGLEEQIDDLPELPNELDENVTLVEDVNAKQPEAGLDTMQAFQFSGTQAHDEVILIDKEQRPEDLRSVPRRKQIKVVTNQKGGERKLNKLSLSRKRTSTVILQACILKPARTYLLGS